MSTRLVTLATYDNVPLAELARLRLEQEGIPVQLENAELVNALWHVGNAFGHVRLLVPEEQAETALSILEGIVSEPKGADSGSAAEQDLCLACGKPMPEGAARCDACGWSYVEAEVPESHDLEPPETPTSAPARRVPVTTTRVTGWKRGALQLWVGILVCGLLFGVGACLITMLQNLRL